VTATVIELRCAVGPRRLFAKIRSTGERPHITDGNLIECACPDCRKRHYPDSTQVLHRFNIIGELVETAVAYADPTRDLIVPGGSA
jgi:hypothetical protein